VCVQNPSRRRHCLLACQKWFFLPPTGPRDSIGTPPYSMTASGAASLPLTAAKATPLSILLLNAFLNALHAPPARQ